MAMMTSEDITLSQTTKITIDRDRLKSKSIFIDAEDKETAIAISAFRNLRTNIFKTMSKDDYQTLLITGPVTSVGKTTTAINLAISIARHSQKTALLIDLDLRRPSIHKVFDYQPTYGIADILSGKASIEDTLITPDIQRLSLLTGRDRHDNSSELLSTKQMEILIHELKNRYPERLLIIDAPPILGCDDVQTMNSFIDACLVVVDEDTKESELKESQFKLRDFNVIGYVLNKSSEAKFDKYYY